MIPPAPSEAGKPMQQSGEAQSLDKNLREQNTSNQMRQLERLQNRYNAPTSDGVQVDKAQVPVP